MSAGEPALIVRRCRAEDLRPLEWSGMFTAHRELIEAAYARQLSGEVEMLVAERAGRPVAQLWIDLVKRADERAGVLWALRVHPSLQGQGIGTALMGAAEAWLRAHGYAQVELGVEKDNPRARKLYERLGYQYIGDLCEHYSYTLPSGARVHATADQWVFKKRL